MEQSKQEFDQNFNKLCIDYGLNPKNRQAQCYEYFKSNLSKLSSFRFNKLIEKAKNELQVRPGFLPQVSALNKLVLELPKRQFEAKNKNRCEICKDSGWVIMERERDKRRGVFCCTCMIGREKMFVTKLGKDVGTYVEAQNRDFDFENKETIKVVLDSLPF